MSNLKQLGLGFAQYTQDYDERYPKSAETVTGNVNQFGSWIIGNSPWTVPTDVSQGALYPYVKSRQIFICPSDSNASAKGISYSMNLLTSGRNIAQNDQPAQTMLIVDESATLNDGNFNAIACGGMDKPTVIHLEGFNAAFTDGHAKWRRPDTLTKGDFRFAASDCP